MLLRLSGRVCRVPLIAKLSPGVKQSDCPGDPGAGDWRARPPYQGHAMDLFDDAIDPQSVGLGSRAGAIEERPSFANERRSPTPIVRVRITTVTGKQEDSGPAASSASSSSTRSPGRTRRPASSRSPRAARPGDRHRHSVPPLKGRAASPNGGIKSAKEIEAMRVAGRMAGETLVLVGEKLRAGMTTEDINTLVHEDTLKGGAARAAQLPRLPEERLHVDQRGRVPRHPRRPGAQGRRHHQRRRHHDLQDGFHGDTSATFYIGTPSAEARHVVEVARSSLELGIAEVKDGARLGDIGAAIQEYVEAQGCSVVRDFVGHGIGRKFHEAPQVKHYGKRGTGERMKTGMIFTIEPMVNIGGFEVVVDPDDKWTVTHGRRLAVGAVRAHRRRHEDRRRGAHEAAEAAPSERERRDRLRVTLPTSRADRELRAPRGGPRRRPSRRRSCARSRRCAPDR